MTSLLHVEAFGSGTDLVLLHGWGMHGGVGGDFALRLAASHRVHVIDLPGHGYSNWLSFAPHMDSRTASPLFQDNTDLPSFRHGLPESMDRDVAGPLHHPWPWMPAIPAGMTNNIDNILPPGDGQGEGKETLLDQTLSALLENTPPSAIWFGWSLSGTLAALLAEQHPARVRGLILLACNPCFVRRPDWPWGMDEAVFEAFAAEIGTNAPAGLRRFSGLLCQGLDEPRPVLKMLRERLETRPAPNPHALAVGLDWLRQLDARPVLSRLSCPVLLAGGDRDALVPYAALEALAELNPSIRPARIDGASHVPFLSHEEETLAQLRSFLDECIAGP